MTDLLTTISQLKRPRLLVRAARFGQADYNRNRDLRRLVQVNAVPAPEQALARLLVEEEALEQSRRAGETGYCLMRHIELLIAMMAEARLAAPRLP